MFKKILLSPADVWEVGQLFTETWLILRGETNDENFSLHITRKLSLYLAGIRTRLAMHQFNYNYF